MKRVEFAYRSTRTFDARIYADLARVIHEQKLQQSQLGACWCFVKLGPAVDLARSSRTPSFAKCQHAPRGWRSRPIEAVGDFAHE